MTSRWNVLAVEDSPTDFALIERTLDKANRLGYCQRVDTVDQIEKETGERRWDVVLCDHHIPGLEFQDCFKALKSWLPGVPIILISGGTSIEEAVALIKQGVADFVPKDRFARLVTAIERSLREVADRAASQAERELAESKRFVQSTLDALSDHLAVLDEGGTILAVNRAWRAFATENGIAPDRVSEGVNYLEACENAGEEGLAIATQVRAALAGERTEGVYDYPCHGPGIERWFQCRVTRFADEGPPRIVVAHKDRTAERRAENSMRAREVNLLGQRNALIALNEHPAFDHADPGQAIRRITETVAQIIGVGRVSVWRFNSDNSAIQCLDLYDATGHEHTQGMELAATVFPRYFDALAASEIIAADDARNDPLTAEFVDTYFATYGIGSMMDVPIHLGGAMVGVLCHEHVGSPRRWTSDEKSFALAAANLVSLALEEFERQRAEDQLRLHSAALNAASNSIVITDTEGVVTWANPAFAAMAGYDLEESIGRKIQELVDSGTHDKSYFRDLWTTILSGHLWNGTIVNRRKDGTHYTESQRIAPIRDGDGKITHFVAIKEDVTEKIEAEASLLKAQELLGRAVDAGNIILWEWDLATDAVTYSDRLPTQHDVNPHMLHTTMTDVLTQVNANDVGPLRQVFSDCKLAPGKRFQKEYRVIQTDSETRWILMGVSAQADSEGRAIRITGTNVDITDRKRLEAEYRQAQKMESIGRLAGGVAHDFNNLLGVISGYAEIALESLDKDAPQQDHIEQIRHATERATGLTRQLLAFSRRQLLQPVVLDINGTVNNTEKMLRRLIGADVELEVETAPDLGHALVDPGQLEQVLMNLAVNARDAMPNGGRLTLGTCNWVVDEEEAHVRQGVYPGDYVCLTVRDTGIGMDRRTRERIFEPFFTTKEKGKGTGLGLATVYGIVKQSSGSIYCDSSPGNGAEFRVYLPRVDAPVKKEARAAVTDDLETGTETVLLVEDEEALRAVTEIILTRVGYTVATAEDGKSAISVFESHPAKIDLLLTDVVMPGSSGPELAAALKSISPDIKVLFMSGYADETIVDHGILDEGVHFINKPFKFAELTRKIREVLNATDN